MIMHIMHIIYNPNAHYAYTLQNHIMHILYNAYVRRSLVHRNSQGHMSARNSEFRMSSVEEDCASVTLDPLEHEWMMCTADGEWDSLQRLLECEPTLISKKDFVTGFTCLHWAAKQGRHELFAMLVDFAKRHGVAINVNVRSSAGYTPLHLAAMHNHIEVMKLLVGAYDADVDVRDYSGKKAAQYLRASVKGDIRDIIGACANSDAENASGAGRWKLPKVLQSNLNPLRNICKDIITLRSTELLVYCVVKWLKNEN
uniref:Sosondowah ankyrin repeat domain family Ca n=1 Tax=Cyprinus carpio TaxID=7962 RepID=A0A8C2A1R0_CYPCA